MRERPPNRYLTSLSGEEGGFVEFRKRSSWRRCSVAGETRGGIYLTMLFIIIE